MVGKTQSTFTVYKAKPKIIVDGSNIAYSQRTHNGKPQAAHLVKIQRSLERLGYQPIIVVDSSLYYEVADQNNFEQLINEGVIYEVPLALEIEQEIINLSDKYSAQIVSNNLFELYVEEHPEIESRTIQVYTESGQVELSQIQPAGT